MCDGNLPPLALSLTAPLSVILPLPLPSLEPLSLSKAGFGVCGVCEGLSPCPSPAFSKTAKQVVESKVCP